MNVRTLLSLGIYLTILTSNLVLAEDRSSFGIGKGSMYNGMGASYGFQSQNSHKYIALGCTSVTYSTGLGSRSNCGVGAGFIMTDLFQFEGNRHGFGLHLGATYSETYSEMEYYIAPQYVYFFNKINASGWNLGVSAGVGRFDGEADIKPLLQVGYQF